MNWIVNPGMPGVARFLLACGLFGVVASVAIAQGGNQSLNNRSIVVPPGHSGALLPGIVGAYDPRTRELFILERQEFSLATPYPGRTQQQDNEVIWHCDENVFCCVSLDKGGCIDFLFACKEMIEGPVDTPINGGQGGTCTFPPIEDE